MMITDGPVAALTADRHVTPGEVGEVVVRGPVVSPAYADRPEATDAAKLDWDGELAHRMGDLASADAEGRLWFAGRKSHVVHTAEGPLFSVPCEEVFRRHPAVRRCALVGVGDVGAQQPVLVAELEHPAPRDDQDLIDALLTVGATEARTRAITTVLFHPGLPVDPRHNSKIDREALSGWAATRVTP
jgi:acyl-CoA synthetase (AMP-forming)/AMP-acid ligase II